MTRYTTLTHLQLFVLSIITGLIAGALVLGTQIYSQYVLLPKVVTDGNQCIKVVNYENGHAFGCPDVDLLLRRYRRVAAVDTPK